MTIISKQDPYPAPRWASQFFGGIIRKLLTGGEHVATGRGRAFYRIDWKMRSAGGSRAARRPSVWFVALAAQNKAIRPRGWNPQPKIQPGGSQHRVFIIEKRKVCIPTEDHRNEKMRNGTPSMALSVFPPIWWPTAGIFRAIVSSVIA